MVNVQTSFKVSVQLDMSVLIVGVFYPPVAHSILLISGELFGALRGRLYDSNKRLVMEALSTIGGVASAMGVAVEKASKVLYSPQLIKLYMF